ncbi:MAG: hypothetical protein JWO74_3409, partial [Solirubrobacterales bacterium]|nr:hypothetical protein [Solirubrobacterales bacterium]
MTGVAGPHSEIIRAGGAHVEGLLRRVEARLAELVAGHGEVLA